MSRWERRTPSRWNCRVASSVVMACLPRVVLNSRRDASNLRGRLIAPSSPCLRGWGFARLAVARFDYARSVWPASSALPVPGLASVRLVVPDQPASPADRRHAGADLAGGSQGKLQPRPRPRSARARATGIRTSWQNPPGRVREYLEVLRSILRHRHRRPSRHRVHRRSEWPSRTPRWAPYPVYVAAMGPKALRVDRRAGRRTLPYLAGPRTSRTSFVRPSERRRPGVGRPHRSHRGGPGDRV